MFATVITDIYGKHEYQYVNVLTMYKKLNIAPVFCFHSSTSLDTVIFLQKVWIQEVPKKAFWTTSLTVHTGFSHLDFYIVNCVMNMRAW